MRTVLRTRLALSVVGLAVLTLAACGSDGADAGVADRPRLVVTTSILGDVVQNLVGDAAEVEVLMPPGAEPHEVAPSARQVVSMRSADALVINGLGFEAGFVDAIEAAERDGTAVITATDGVETRGEDPHFFADPVRMRAAAAHLATRLGEVVPALATDAVRARTAAYLDDLDGLTTEMTAILDAVPAEHRILVTNHESFDYFAERFEFRVLGAVIPSISPVAAPSAGDLADLAARIREEGVPAIFAESSAPTRLAEALAGEGADVTVVELYAESLGPDGSDGATYLDMMRTNARLIVGALG